MNNFNVAIIPHPKTSIAANFIALDDIWDNTIKALHDVIGIATLYISQIMTKKQLFQEPRGL